MAQKQELIKKIKFDNEKKYHTIDYENKAKKERKKERKKRTIKEQRRKK